jgi:hypothetical protein
MLQIPKLKTKHNKKISKFLFEFKLVARILIKLFQTKISNPILFV